MYSEINNRQHPYFQDITSKNKFKMAGFVTILRCVTLDTEDRGSIPVSPISIGH